MLNRTMYVWNDIILFVSTTESGFKQMVRNAPKFRARKAVIHVISIAGCFVLMHVPLIINACHFSMMLATGCNVKAINYMEQSP
jgi:putative flippase GtrA